MAVTIVSTEDASSKSVISRWQLQLSETNPAMKIAIASAAVLTDTVSTLTAGLTPNAFVNSGSSGCTQYSSEKLA